MADQVLEGDGKNSCVAWQALPYPAQVWAHRQHVQILCCENQAAFAQMPC